MRLSARGRGAATNLADPDARPIRKGKLRAPPEFGYVVQLAELCENTRRGARGLIVPAASEIGSPNEPDLLPTTAGELHRLDLKPRELALDGGFFPIGVAEDLPGPDRVFIAGRQSAGVQAHQQALRTLQSRNRRTHQHPAQRPPRGRTWVAWASSPTTLDTLAIRTN